MTIAVSDLNIAELDALQTCLNPRWELLFLRQRTIKNLLTASTTPITNVVNACLLWSFEQTHHVVHNSLYAHCQIDYHVQHTSLSFIPTYCNVILTAAAAAAAAAVAAAAAAAAPAATAITATTAAQSTLI